MYDFMIFTAGESPVNYPLDRTKRSLKKSRVKRLGGLHLVGSEEKRKTTQSYHDVLLLHRFRTP